MARAQTVKRRQRVAAQAQAQAQTQAQAQALQDEIGGMHDEADIMSFRSAATQRFLLNQELMENITDKWVHTDSIIAPKPFANVQTTKTNIEELKEELYFGNLVLMRQKVESLDKSIEIMKEEADVSKLFDDNRFLQDAIDKLASGTDFDSDNQIDSIEKSFCERFNKRFTSNSKIVKSIPAINPDTRAAPDTYWEDLEKAKIEAEKRAKEEAEAARVAAEEQARLEQERKEQEEKEKQEQEEREKRELEQRELQQKEEQQQLQRQEELSQAQPEEPVDSHHLLPETEFGIATDGLGEHDPISDFKQDNFPDQGLDMMDDAFQYSNLDDQDFLSQIDHSMEP